MDEKKIARINALAKKAKSPEGLTPEEIKALQGFKNGKDGRFQTFNPD